MCTYLWAYLLVYVYERDKQVESKALDDWLGFGIHRPFYFYPFPGLLFIAIF